MARRLIVTADDVALDRGMTEGAIRAHREGIVTACSIVANGREFDDAVARLREVPTLECGVHLALVGERALTTGERMPANYLRFLLAPPHSVEAELRAQIERVLGAGLRVTHLNGHQHLHQLPRIARIVRRLAREYGIGYIRVINDRGGRAGIVRRAAVGVLNALGDRSRNTIGVAEAGHLTAERIVALLDCVQDLTELVTHPGDAVQSYADWNYAWDEETRALCDPRLRAAITDRGIELMTPSCL